jgi:hypothetical protein
VLQAGTVTNATRSEEPLRNTLFLFEDRATCGCLSPFQARGAENIADDERN